LFLAICAPALAQQETEYLAVFLDGKKVGYGIHTRLVQDGRVTTTEEVSLTISRIGMPVTIQMTETSIETTAGKPLGFESVQQLGAMMTMKVAGTINSSGVVDLTSSSLGTQSKSTMSWPAGRRGEGLRLLTLRQGLKAGTEYTADLFSPGLMQAVSTKVVIGARKEVDLLCRVVKLTEMTTILNMPGTGQITSTSYVDDDLRTLKSTMPIAGMQVEMISCPKEFALGQNDVVEMIDRMFVKSPRSIDDVGSASSIAYLLNPGQRTDLVIPSTDNQTATPTTGKCPGKAGPASRRALLHKG
jgi:hypothetical protein